MTTKKILKEFRVRSMLTASQLAQKFGISRQAIHKRLVSLINQKVILKQGTSRKTTSYVLNTPAVLKKIGKGKPFKKRFKTSGLAEDQVYQELKSNPSLFESLSENSQGTFHYAFTEMLNNAIDHSESRFVDILVEPQPNEILFVITDYGIGVFENIRSKKKLSNELDAIQDLLKGKQTTLPQYHSGEGIFFTSKIAGRFVLESHSKKLLVDNDLPDIFVEDIRYRKGTKVTVTIENKSSKKIEEVFKQYTNEDFQFQKSQIHVKLFQNGEEYVSRSQAKRLLHTLDRFEEIILDFQGVKTIGQGFADEIFRVFASQHPKIKLTPIHANENVLFMIQHVQRNLFA